MFEQMSRGWKVAATALLCALPLIAGAQAPASAPAAAAVAEISVDTATLAQYVGHYKLGDSDIQAIMTVTLNGTQLAAQMTGQPAFEIYARSPTHFFLKVVDAEIDFVATGKAAASAAVLHQGGRDITLPRVDDAVAAQFAADLAKRMAANTPQPGAEADVREVLDRMTKGLPANYSKMSPELAAAVAAQADAAAGVVGRLGTLQSITYQGAPQGADVFLAKFQQSSLLVSIHLNSKGIIDGLLMRPAP